MNQPDPKDEAQARLNDCGIKAGEVYRHYKGGLYTILALAIKEDSLEPLVVYQSNAKGSIWARDLDDFTEVLSLPGYEDLFPRFCFLSGPPVCP